MQNVPNTRTRKLKTDMILVPFINWSRAYLFRAVMLLTCRLSDVIIITSVFTIQKSKDFTDHHSFNWRLNIIGQLGLLTLLRLKFAEWYLKLKYENGNENYHDWALSSLLSASSTISHDDYNMRYFISPRKEPYTYRCQNVLSKDQQ